MSCPPGDGALLLRDGGEALRVEIDTGGEAFDIQAQEIREAAGAADASESEPGTARDDCHRHAEDHAGV